MKHIELATFLQDWEDGMMIDVIVIIDKGRSHLYGKTVKGQAGNPKGFEAVEANVSSVKGVAP